MLLKEARVMTTDERMSMPPRTGVICCPCNWLLVCGFVAIVNGIVCVLRNTDEVFWIEEIVC